MKKEKIMQLIRSFLEDKYSSYSDSEWKTRFDFHVNQRDPNGSTIQFSTIAEGSAVSFCEDLKVITDGEKNKSCTTNDFQQKGGWGSQEVIEPIMVSNATITLERKYKSSSMGMYTVHTLNISVISKADLDYISSLESEIREEQSKKREEKLFEEKINQVSNIVGREIAEAIIKVCNIDELYKLAQAYSTIKIHEDINDISISSWEEIENLNISAEFVEIPLNQAIFLLNLKIQDLSYSEKIEVLKSNFAKRLSS